MNPFRSLVSVALAAMIGAPVVAHASAADSAPPSAEDVSSTARFVPKGRLALPFRADLSRPTAPTSSPEGCAVDRGPDLTGYLGGPPNHRCMSGLLGYATTSERGLDTPAVFTSSPFIRGTVVGGFGWLTIDAVDPPVDAVPAAEELSARYLCRFVVIDKAGRRLSTTRELGCAKTVGTGVSRTRFRLPTILIPEGASIRLLMRNTSVLSSAGRMLFDGYDHLETGLVLQRGRITGVGTGS